MRRSPLRSALLAAVSSLLMFALMPVAMVVARMPVDPSTLTPPPPDFFNAVCYEVGSGRGTICDLAFSDDPIVDEPSGILCGATELLISQTRSVVGKRFYNSDGFLTQRHFREDFAGTITNPLTGATASSVGGDTVIHVLAVPGDISTGTEIITGLQGRIYLPGGGTVLIDVGRVVIDSATGNLVSETGQHPGDAYFVFGDASALQPLCEALGLP